VGEYAADRGYFAAAYSSGPLQVPANGGVYGYGPAGTFPTGSYAASNYWVDVAFAPGSNTGPGPYSIWSAAATPQTADVGDGNPVELGVQFTPAVSGTITGLRFYKGPLNTGTHVADLWSGSGSLLATATFSGETASGWQQVNFSQPVAVTAGTTYVASYHTNVGEYAADRGYFAAAYSSGPLQVPANGGVYAYGPAGSFPTGSYQGSNYWVDIVLSPTSTSSVTAVVQPGAVGLASAGPAGTVSPAVGSGASTDSATRTPSSGSTVSTTGPGAGALAIGTLNFGDDTTGPTDAGSPPASDPVDRNRWPR
jgi:hypothetical protein